ncbi:MAG: hypothetical protein ABI595_16295 [Actinomycetota bacterium]
MPRQWMACILGAVAVAAACATPIASPTSIQAARAELLGLITDVTQATAYRYKLTDDLGHHMGPMDVIWVPEAGRFAAVDFSWDDTDQAFHLHVTTSTNLLDWTWEVELARQASMPSIAAMTGGGYVVAWEQEPDPIHIVIASFDTWDDLRTGNVARRFDVPVTMPACGEGTPSIDAASRERVDLSFHYHGDCERDRQASGWTDWTTWQAVARPERDQALIDRGIEGHIGDRDTIAFRGHTLMLLEGERVPDDYSSWRTFLYDDETRVADEISFKTHAGSRAFTNPSISEVRIDGHDAILVTLYLFTEGARGGEDEELVCYRILPDQ